MSLDNHRISRALVGASLGSEVFVHDEVGSTNDIAMDLGRRRYGHGTLVVADYQSAGRGRRGAEWVAPPGSCILMSILLRPDFARRYWARITPAAALAVCLALESRAKLRPQIKWPNDVYLNGRKLGGILAEVDEDPQGGGFVVVGIGLNVHTDEDDFPPELRGVATSIAAGCGGASPVSREELVISVIREFERLVLRLDHGFGALHSELERRSLLLGREIVWNTHDGGEGRGRAVGLTGEAELIVRGEDGGEEVLAGAHLVRLLEP